MKKVISALIAILILGCCTMSTFAVQDVNPKITILKYNGSKYAVFDGTVSQGDYIQVSVGFDNAVANLASLRVKLEFPGNLAEYVDGSGTGAIVNGNPQAGNPIFTAKGNYVVTYFSSDTVSGDISIGKNVTNIAYYIFYCKSNEGNIDFKVTLDQALDSDYKDIKFNSNKATQQVQISTWSLRESDQAIFKAPENIVYTPECLQCIKAAESKYGSFSANEKLRFSLVYPQYLSLYQQAWTKYYDAAQTAADAQVVQTAEDFKLQYQSVLAISSPEGVNESNYEQVLKACSDYKKLDTRVKNKLTNQKALLDSLSEKAASIESSLEDREIADDFANVEFIAGFKETLWDLDDNTVVGLYQEVQKISALAQATYKELNLDNMSGAVKSEVKTYYEKLEHVLDLVSKAAKAANEDESIAEEITQFTTKWYKVIKLNALKTGVGDETAIKLMLEDYEKLSDTARERLATYKSSAEQLLLIIDSYKAKAEVPSSNNNKNQNAVVITPQGGTTTEIIKKVEVPVEVEKVSTLVNTKIREMPKIVYTLLLLMCIAVLTMFLPIGYYFIVYKKSLRKEQNNDIT